MLCWNCWALSENCWDCYPVILMGLWSCQVLEIVTKCYVYLSYSMIDVWDSGMFTRIISVNIPHDFGPYQVPSMGLSTELDSATLQIFGKKYTGFEKCHIFVCFLATLLVWTMTLIYVYISHHIVSEKRTKLRTKLLTAKYWTIWRSATFPD